MLATVRKPSPQGLDRQGAPRRHQRRIKHKRRRPFLPPSLLPPPGGGIPNYAILIMNSLDGTIGTSLCGHMLTYRKKKKVGTQAS